MKRFIFMVLALMMFTPHLFSQEHYAFCKVLEKDQKVKIEFSKEVKYLGNEYEKTIVFFNDKRLSFTDGQEAVSYLSSSWGWELCGDVTQLKDGAVMWTMRHQIDKNTVNFEQNLRALQYAKKRYTERQDEVYRDFQESH